ncbi:MAG: LysR family transcriptional regulator [Bdellovibrionales bacterium]|nr:LysR family transcriptional regulator [Bdellovibrionales bacterium]
MTVSRLRSIQKACRDLRLNPPNVSKILQKMEQKAGARLMVRDRAGVTLTPEGIRFLKTAEEILEIAPDLNMALRTMPSRMKPQEVVSVGSLSFVCNRLISHSLAEWNQQKPEYRFRVVEFTHNKLVEYSHQEAFDVAVHIEPLSWPRKWTSEKVGEFQWGLFGRKGHPLGLLAKSEDVARYPFVIPTGWSEKDSTFSIGNDQCPMPINRRIIGSEATTAETALEIIQSVPHLVYTPVFAAARMVESGRIQRIEVQDWPEVIKTLYITANSERMKRSVFLMMKNELRHQMVKSSAT